LPSEACSASIGIISRLKMTIRFLFCALVFLCTSLGARGEILYSLRYATSFGDTSWEHVHDIYTDAVGLTYVVGGTSLGNFAGASSFPGPNTYNAGSHNFAPGSGDAWVARFINNDHAGESFRKIEAPPGGGMKVIFARIPGLGDLVQSSDTLAVDSWMDRATLLPDAPGEYEFIDPPPLPSWRFYRAIAP
jgi:hypothetical protein